MCLLSMHRWTYHVCEANSFSQSAIKVFYRLNQQKVYMVTVVVNF